MGGDLATRGRAPLLGRERELAELDRLLSEVAGGAARGFLIEGPAGIGKSALVGEAGVRAGEAGMTVLSARGGELERDLAFGIARQLFERPLASLQKRALTRVSAGAAAPAAAMLDPSGHVKSRFGGEVPDEASLVHSLYWLCSNLAARAPLLVVVDDLQWADRPSQRWLAYLAHRLEARRIVLLLAWRTGEAGVEREWLEALAGEPRVSVARPDPLDEPAVGELVRRGYGAEVEGEFSRAFHFAGGGNPFLTIELIAAAAEKGISPTAAAAEQIRGLGPEAVARDVLRRIGGLGSAAERVARAVAILGTDVELASAADLAELSSEDASVAADGLARARVLRAERPLEFIHPVVRSVVYEDIPVGERSQAHMRAARRLVEQGRLEESAVHLLSTEPSDDQWVVETLRSAARSALAPETAATYLRRVDREQGLEWLLPMAGGALADALTECAKFDEAEEILAATEMPGGGEGNITIAAFHRHNRARLRLMQGRAEQALDDFYEAGRVMVAATNDHPAFYPWRSGAALAHLAFGQRDEARPLVAEELEMARAFGARRSLGVSLRTAGLVEGGEPGSRLLREAVGVLEGSPAELERARAIVELGSALRRAGERNEAREILRRGLELADRCGSVVLAARAREELHTLGARPRRAAISGVESLTRSEQRVASLAAEGLGNREIAQRLVVSPKTVENQLGHVYRKLGISSRTELHDALAMQAR